jgi:hypothetical protein
VYCQKDIDNLKFKKHTIYLFSRGTKTKSGLIADKFNISDKNITHVGIGFIKNDSLKIYNVIDCDTTKNALRVDNLKSFVNDDKIYYLSIWECKNNKNDYKNLVKVCDKYIIKKIFF